MYMYLLLALSSVPDQVRAARVYTRRRPRRRRVTP